MGASRAAGASRTTGAPTHIRRAGLALGFSLLLPFGARRRRTRPVSLQGPDRAGPLFRSPPGRERPRHPLRFQRMTGAFFWSGARTLPLTRPSARSPASTGPGSPSAKPARRMPRPRRWMETASPARRGRCPWRSARRAQAYPGHAPPPASRRPRSGNWSRTCAACSWWTRPSRARRSTRPQG